MDFNLYTTEEFIILLTIGMIIIIYFLYLPIVFFSKAKGIFNNFWD